MLVHYVLLISLLAGGADYEQTKFCDNSVKAIASWSMLELGVVAVLNIAIVGVVLDTLFAINSIPSECEKLTSSVHWLNRTAIRSALGPSAKQCVTDFISSFIHILLALPFAFKCNRRVMLLLLLVWSTALPTTSATRPHTRKNPQGVLHGLVQPFTRNRGGRAVQYLPPLAQAAPAAAAAAAIPAVVQPQLPNAQLAMMQAQIAAQQARLDDVQARAAAESAQLRSHVRRLENEMRPLRAFMQVIVLLAMVQRRRLRPAPAHAPCG